MRTAVENTIELRPDVVIADVAAQEHEWEWEALTRAIQASSAEKTVPLLVLEREADPRTVLQAIEGVLATSRRASARATSVGDRSSVVVGRSQTALLDQSAPPKRESPSAARPCPSCECPLVWTQRSVLDGVQYDYYEWCANGCGLYCLDVAAGNWLKLA